MINSSETIAPVSRPGARINTDKTIPPAGMPAAGAVLAAGDTISDSYVISGRNENKGSQSTVYIAKKSGKTYAVKVYNNGWKPSPELQRFLATTRHPNIARVLESGEYNGSYYEIYEYFHEGTLENAGKLPISTITNIVIPSINEGLHELHKNGIVHCDIKPGNLFFSDDRKRIVIGDCAISGFMNSAGKYIDTIRGTPEYSPRVETIGTNAIMSPAFDYGSFGLVLCKVSTGRSLFEGMSLEEIAMARETGIVLPSQITGRLETLIKGLLKEEEDARWGYKEIKRWCDGEFMRPVGRNIYDRPKKEKKKEPLIFGRFDNNTIIVSTLDQLADAIVSHWDQAKRVVSRSDIVPFIRQFDNSLTDQIRELARMRDKDAAVFKLLTYLKGGSEDICFCGKRYEDLSDYVEKLASGSDETAIHFMTSGMLVFFLRFNGKDALLIDKLEKLISRGNAGDMETIRTICFALQGTRSIDIYGMTVNSLDDVINVFSRLPVSRIDLILNDASFLAWLNRMGYEHEVRKMREAFQS